MEEKVVAGGKGVKTHQGPMTREEFFAEHVIPLRPVVIKLKDAMRDPVAFKKFKRKWGCLQGWKDSKLGEEKVSISVASRSHTRDDHSMSLATYIDRFDEWRHDQEEDRSDEPKEDRKEAQRILEVPYLSDFIFWKYEGGVEFLKDLWGEEQERLPEFLEDWIQRYNLVLDMDFIRGMENNNVAEEGQQKKVWKGRRQREGTEKDEDYKIQFNMPFCYLFIGPRGTISKLHTDDHTTHGWLLQIVGRKQFRLWSPEQFPFAKHTPCEVVLQPYDMLYVPFRWGHEVTALDDSISLQWRHLCTDCTDRNPIN